MTNLIKKLENALDSQLINHEDLKQIVSDINSYDGSLDHLEYYENDEHFFDMMFQNPMDAVRAVCYGEYNYTDDYVQRNAYGNLESKSDYEIRQELEEEISSIREELLNTSANVSLGDTTRYLVSILENNMAEEKTSQEFINYLKEEYDLEIDGLSFVSMSQDELDELLTEDFYEFQGIYTNLEEAVDGLMDDSTSLYKVEEFYILF